MTGLGCQNEGCKPKMCVKVVRPVWGGPRWGWRDGGSGMIGSRVWEIEGVRDLEGGISFQIPGFEMSDGRDRGKSS